MLESVLAVNKSVDRENAIHIHVVVYGCGPVSWPRGIEKPEADLSRGARTIFLGCAVGPPMAEFQICLGAKPVATSAIAEDDCLTLGARRSFRHDFKPVDHGRSFRWSVTFSAASIALRRSIGT